MTPVLPAAGFEAELHRLGRALVLFTADWCPFCRRFGPLFEQAAARHGTRVAFAVADISDDDADPRWDRYGIAAVPTVLYFEEGGVAARLDGALGLGLGQGAFEAFVATHAP